MRRRLMTAVAVSLVMLVVGGGASWADSQCTSQCAEKDDKGKCVRLEKVCRSRDDGGVSVSGSDTKGYGSNKKCYQCTEWYPSGDCKKSKVVDC